MSTLVIQCEVKCANLFLQYDAKDDSSTATAEFEPEVGDHGKLLKCLGENPRSVSSTVEDQQTINVQCKFIASLSVHCHARFLGAFTACCGVFKDITLVGANQCNFFENANSCSKGSVANRLKGLINRT